MDKLAPEFRVNQTKVWSKKVAESMILGLDAQCEIYVKIILSLYL